MTVLSVDRPLRRITDVSRALTYARSLDEVLDLTVACAVDLLATDRAVLMLDDEGGLLRIRAAHGVAPETVARFREPLDENLLTRLDGVLGLDDPDAFMGVPLVVRGQVIGLLGVRRRAGDETGVNAQEEWLLSALADQAAVALESARHQRAREVLAGRLGEMERDRAGKDQAIQVMSHDIRTPLNAIQGYASLLTDGILGPLNDRQADALRRIQSVGKHLEVLLDNMLDMARLQAGGLEIRREPILLTAVVEEAREIVASAAERAAIRLDLAELAQVTVSADRGRLRQVLVQLIDNAVKYSPDGGTVRLEVRRVTTADGEWGEIAVIDAGPGIPEEQREGIFEPYHRSDGRTDRSRTGAGLGLAIARGLAQQMGGKVLLESEVGRGSVFAVRLPLGEVRGESGH